MHSIQTHINRVKYTITAPLQQMLRTLSLALLCLLPLTTTSLAASQPPPVSNSEALSVNHPRLLKQLLNSEQAQHSIQVILAKQPLNTAPSQHPFTSAALSFLREHALSVDVIHDLSQLKSALKVERTLFLFCDNTQCINQPHTDLLAWVAQGGHLVISAHHTATAHPTAALLQQLGIHKIPAALLKGLGDPQELPLNNTKTEPHKPRHLTRLYLENEQSPAYFALDTQNHLEDRDKRTHAWANSQAATQLMQLTYADGLITVLSDFKLWQPQHIGHYDHAWLLWYLSQDTDVTLLSQATPPAWRAQFWQPQRLIVAALIFLLLLASGYAVLRHMGRLSTPLSSTPNMGFSRAQRRALAQLTASAQRRLLTALQQEIQQRAQKHHPNFTALVVVEQWQILRQLSGLPVTFIAHSMRPPITEKRATKAFTQHLIQLQQLKNSL